MRILTAAQMREADRATIEELGIPSLVLMENAGRQVVAAIEAAHEGLEHMRVGILAGQGNNGGDGFVVARTLLLRGVDVLVFLLGRAQDVRGDARSNLEILGRLGLSVFEVGNDQDWDLHSSSLWECDLVVDAIFGTGLKAPLEGLFQTVVADLNASGLPVVAIDVPSGLSCDTAELIGDAVQASTTVALGALKVPHVLPPAERKCGDLVVADIGIPEDLVEGVDGPRLELLTQRDMRGLVPPRDPQGHKGDYGRVLIVAGSLGRTGAAHLAAWAALKSGAGLVTVATPRSLVPIVAAMAPEYMTLPLDEEDGCVAASAAEQVLAQRADVIAMGPGLGTHAGARALVEAVLARSGVPVLLDADALSVFAGDTDALSARDGLDVIVTPHPGEMARLLGTSVEHVQSHRVDVARDFAARHRVHVVLKGHRSLVAHPDGTVAVNVTGNPGMGTGGTGDVLTGVIAAWLAQLLDAPAACRLAVYLHGLAGDLTEADEGAIAMTAGDLVLHLGDAVMELTSTRRASS